MASLVSSGTTRGERPSVPESASIASELVGTVIAIGWVGSLSASYPTTARGRYDISDLGTREAIFENSKDFAPRRPNHD